jgi:hypothetical protein
MTEWWEQGYAGGPMVVVKGFPRPLYPPDANEHGKKPSMPGPDVEAYKRTVCRAGRWGEWDPKLWDESYSNAFAHGRGGNVEDTGIAGVQRQQDIDDTGWLGEKTFKTLRSIRVPDGPHAGEMAMDAFAAELIDEAWDIFGGHEPDSTGSTLRKAALQQAITQLGIKESPPDSNNVKYCDWYGMVGPWCAMFCAWCYEHAGNSPSFAKGSKYAYVPYIVSDARAQRNGLRVVGTDEVTAGDLVCYDWSWDGEFDHVGIFEGWRDNEFTAIEGNTSTSNNSNGGQVMRRTRLASTQATVFVRVSEP